MNFISREQVLAVLDKYEIEKNVLDEISALASFERKPIADVGPTAGADPNFNWGGDP